MCSMLSKSRKEQNQPQPKQHCVMPGVDELRDLSFAIYCHVTVKLAQNSY